MLTISLYILVVLGGPAPAMAEDGLRIRFQRNLELNLNQDAEEQLVFTRFNEAGTYSLTPASVRGPLRGCEFYVPTKPNERALIPQGREVRLVRTSNNSVNYPLYLMLDPASGTELGSVQCYQPLRDGVTLLTKLREYLDAVPAQAGTNFRRALIISPRAGNAALPPRSRLFLAVSAPAHILQEIG